MLSRPLEVLIGLCIFAAAASGCAVSTVASTSLAILFVTCLFYIHQWPELWRALTRNEQLLLFGLALYAFSGLISYYNVSDENEYVKHMGRYIRFLLIVPVYLLLTKGNMKLFKYLVAGVITSGPLYLSFALISISERPGFPASGDYHHIAFGDAAMLSVVFLLAVLVTWKTRPLIKVIVAFSIICALYASLLSQARGAWIALPFCGALLLYMMAKHNKLKLKLVLSVLLLVVVVIGISPVRNMVEDRFNQAAQEVESFMNGEKFGSSVGTRLAMWHIALNVWQEHPVIGTGLGDFDQEIELRQSQGIYEQTEVHASAHNIYFQALATTGLVGFLILCFALVIQPFRLFYHASREKLTPASLGGLIMIMAYVVFGLTATWNLRAPELSVFLVYLITLSVTVSRSSKIVDPLH